MDEILIRLFKNKEGLQVAGLTPEHAVFDTEGKRLDEKMIKVQGDIAERIKICELSEKKVGDSIEANVTFVYNGKSVEHTLITNDNVPYVICHATQVTNEGLLDKYWVLQEGKVISSIYGNADLAPAWVKDNTTENKVTKEEGKGLSTNDYTNEEKAKLAKLPSSLSNGEGDASLVQDTCVAEGSSAIATGNITQAMGDFSSATGDSTIATGEGSHAEGANTNASGLYAHAEGDTTRAQGTASHAEGSDNTAAGEYTHAEGQGTTAEGVASHAEGFEASASANYSHAEGKGTTASGKHSHSEGDNTVASGEDSHSEGFKTTAVGIATHAEGYNTIAEHDYSHAEGYQTLARGKGSHVEGITANYLCTQVRGDNDHLFLVPIVKEGGSTTEYFYSDSVAAKEIMENTRSGNTDYRDAWACGNIYFYESWDKCQSDDSDAPTSLIYAKDTYRNWKPTSVTISGDKGIEFIPNDDATTDIEKQLATYAKSYQFARIYLNSFTRKAADGAHVEGISTIATKDGAHAEGDSNIANGYASHTEGYDNINYGEKSHVEGENNLIIAGVTVAHVEGNSNVAMDANAHAEGVGCVAIGANSHASGLLAIATSNSFAHNGISGLGGVTFGLTLESLVCDLTFESVLNDVVMVLSVPKEIIDVAYNDNLAYAFITYILPFVLLTIQTSSRRVDVPTVRDLISNGNVIDFEDVALLILQFQYSSRDEDNETITFMCASEYAQTFFANVISTLGIKEGDTVSITIKNPAGTIAPYSFNVGGYVYDGDSSNVINLGNNYVYSGNVIGHNNSVPGFTNSVIGEDNSVLGQKNVAIGIGNYVTLNNAVAIGANNMVKGTSTSSPISIGTANNVTNLNIAVGHDITTLGTTNTCLGEGITVGNDIATNNILIGSSMLTASYNNIYLGNNIRDRSGSFNKNIVIGGCSAGESIILGSNNINIGWDNNDFLNSGSSIMIGEGLTSPELDGLILGKYNKVSNSPFIIGNGTAADAHSNLFEIKTNGDLIVTDTDHVVSDSNSFSLLKTLAALISFHPYKKVDLGLPSGLLWAPMNVGASSEADYGEYFQWGGVTGHLLGDGYSFSSSEYPESSLIADITPDSGHDAARVNMGGKWRMPTKAEFEELCNTEYCVWSIENLVNSKGDTIYCCKVTSVTNGNSIYLPVAGYIRDNIQKNYGSGGDYWSSSYYNNAYASFLAFNNTNLYPLVYSDAPRYSGLPIRAVWKD